MTGLPTLDILNRITDSIYLGNSSAAKNLSLLKSTAISHVLICCSEVGPSFAETFIYKKLNIQETFDFNIGAHFAEAYDFIESAINADGRVLVYCMQGQSRSPTIVISYLIKKYGLTCRKALKTVKHKHPITEPNAGFIDQLSDYEKIIKDSNPSMTCSVCKCLIQ
jgi:hypothetical protein